MNTQFFQELENCFSFCGKPQEACKLVEDNLKSIDFDDDDDVQRLLEILERALLYEGNDGTDQSEEGVRFLEFLISKGLDVNFKLGKNECLILALAERAIKPETFRKVVDLGADVYSETTFGSNVLTRSAKTEFKSWFKTDVEISERLPLYLVEHFDLSRLDHPDEYGITPLMYAVMKNKPNLADALLKHGSDVNATGGQFAGGCSYWMKMYGVSPLALAFREGNVEMAKKLLDAGADETICDAEGTPALFSLVYHSFDYRDKSVPQTIEIDNRKSQIAALLKNLDFTDSDGNTLLMKAMTMYDYSRDKRTSPFDNKALMSMLIQRGVNVNAANNQGKRALHFAAEYWGDIIKELLSAGADIDAQDNDGNTALIIECKKGSEKEARLLIRKGADINIKNKEGKSAADIAAEKGLADVLELMM